mmetsp:Transcript_7474/g.13522  ORF Transcript_7474/g.13522 Transcript_7474/m.13522 type:complete len:289 (-) Transcript_7474:2656-3522(-)
MALTVVVSVLSEVKPFGRPAHGRIFQALGSLRIAVLLEQLGEHQTQQIDVNAVFLPHESMQLLDEIELNDIGQVRGVAQSHHGQALFARRASFVLRSLAVQDADGLDEYLAPGGEERLGLNLSVHVHVLSPATAYVNQVAPLAEVVQVRCDGVLPHAGFSGDDDDVAHVVGQNLDHGLQLHQFLTPSESEVFRALDWNERGRAIHIVHVLLALQFDRRLHLEANLAVALVETGLVAQNFVLLSIRHEPRRQVDPVAHHGVLLPALGSDDSAKHASTRDADLALEAHVV